MPRLSDIAQKLNKPIHELGIMVRNQELKTERERKKNNAKFKRDIRFAKDFRDWACSTIRGYGRNESKEDDEWETVERDGHIPAKFAGDPQMMADFAC